MKPSSPKLFRWERGETVRLLGVTISVLKPTVPIFGAGASTPFDFLSGRNLLFNLMEYLAQTTSVLFANLRELCHSDYYPFTEAASSYEFSRQFSLCQSRVSRPNICHQLKSCLNLEMPNSRFNMPMNVTVQYQSYDTTIGRSWLLYCRSACPNSPFVC